MLRVRATARLALGLLWCLSVTAVSAQAEEARARKIVSGSCFVCHGAEGESGSEAFPRLAGQHWEYTAKQLDNFKSGKRKSTAMAAMAARLSSDEMQALGRYFEKMSLPPEPVTQPELVAKGRVLYHQGNTQSDVPACASCHGPTALGTATLPRLAGQYAAYIETQLQQFSKRERTNDNAVMHTIVSKMTGPEMAAVAHYLASK